MIEGAPIGMSFTFHDMYYRSHDSTYGKVGIVPVKQNGQTVGYVANEDVSNSAREAVQERINYAVTDHAK